MKKRTKDIPTLSSPTLTQLHGQESERRLRLKTWNRPKFPEYRYPSTAQGRLTVSEERQLMLRLEELARLEGLRGDRTRAKISSAIQALIDSKAAENDVLKHDGSVEPSADWEIGSGRRLLSGGKSIDCPTYIYIKATNQTEGSIHLSDANNWGTSKALIKLVRVATLSTNWDLYILQNDNGYTVDDANIPKMQIVEACNGNANIHLDLPYEDEDISDEVHLYYIDNSGTNTADIYIIGYEMV